MPVTWSFFGTQGKLSTPLFWKLAANEFLLLYFFCSMSRRGEKNAKNGQKWSKITKKKINLSNDGNRQRWTFSIISYLKASLTPPWPSGAVLARPVSMLCIGKAQTQHIGIHYRVCFKHLSILHMYPGVFPENKSNFENRIEAR